MESIKELEARTQALRTETKQVLNQNGADPRSNEADYVFITFVLQELPRGVVGLLVAVILCATMSATAAALNALGSTTVVDLYRPLRTSIASDHHYVVAAKIFTAAWRSEERRVGKECRTRRSAIQVKKKKG